MYSHKRISLKLLKMYLLINKRISVANYIVSLQMETPGGGVLHVFSLSQMSLRPQIHCVNNLENFVSSTTSVVVTSAQLTLSINICSSNYGTPFSVLQAAPSMGAL
jgi:hypothetical protein